MKSLFICFAFICMAFFSYAQDLMYLRGQSQPLKVKVVELGLDEIKYKYWPVNEDAVVQVIAKENVSKIVMQNGDVYEFKNEGIHNPANYANQKKNAIKMHFLSPLFGHLGLSYERSLKPGRSYELGLGIIGAGVQYKESETYSGVFVRAGLKLITSPDFYLRGMRYAHLLKGAYVKPEVVMGYYNVSYNGYWYYNGAYQNYDLPVTFGGVLINLGKQWVFDDAFLLDLYTGVGYGFSIYNGQNTYYETNAQVYHFAFLGGHTVFPIAISAGMKIGFLVGKKGEATELKKP